MGSIIATIVLLVTAVLVLGLIVAIVKSGKPEGGGDLMIKNIYIYLVLFATLMMTIGGSVAAFMAVADIVFPAPYYQSFEEYKQMGGVTKDINNEDIEKLSDSELEDRYNAMLASELYRQKSRAQNSLIKSVGWIIVPLPVFVYFQRRLGEKGKEIGN